MSEQNIKKIPVIIIIICAVLGIIGYSIGGSEEPLRVLFKTSGGPVVFDHNEHKEYDIECDKCHHELDVDEEIWNCRACHSKGIEDYQGICDERPIHKQCIGANCIDCHKENDIDTDDCKACHQ